MLGFQVTWAGGLPSPYLTLKSWVWEDVQGTSGPALAWSLGACHAEGAGTQGRLRGCLKRRESTGASSLKRRESTGALIQPALASSLVTRGPCGCSFEMPGEALIGSWRGLERETLPAGALAASSFRLHSSSLGYFSSWY